MPRAYQSPAAAIILHPMKYALAVTSNKDAHRELSGGLSREYVVESTESVPAALTRLESNRFDFLFLDIGLLIDFSPRTGPKPDLHELLRPFRRILPSAGIIVLCPPESTRLAVDAVKAGADNYLPYPVDAKEAKYIVETTIEATRAQFELDYFRDQFWNSDSLRIVSTKNEHMKEVFGKIKSVAPALTTVLLTGDTGTGKGVMAKLIHSHSPRKDRQFISVHCGAIPENLIESELFGHEKGAFTGAVRRKLGKFEIAHGGTLFLDEVGTMPPSAQVKLLRVLQERIIQRVGGEDDIRVDVRLIAATNENIRQMVENGEFRRDLYYRLNVFPIELPPLSRRTEDIPQLSREILHRLNKENTKQISDIAPEVLASFSRYDWPGNIRELENLMERAFILESSHILTPQSFPHEIPATAELPKKLAVDFSQPLSEVRRRTYEEVEKEYLRKLLEEHHGRIDASAEAAGISPRQLHKLLTRYEIRKEYFRHKSSDSSQNSTSTTPL